MECSPRCRWVQSTSALVLISYFSQHFSSNPLHNYMNCWSFPEAVNSSCIHFQMASGEAAWALDQIVNVPYSNIDNPLDIFWHICQGPPGDLQNSSPLADSKKGGGARNVSIPSFNMVICLGAAPVIAKLDSCKGNCFFKLRMSFFKHLKFETNESQPQVQGTMGRRLAR